MKSMLQELKKINEEAAAGTGVTAADVGGFRAVIGGADVNSQSEFKKKKKKTKMRRRPMNVSEEASTFDQADVISKLKQAERANVTDDQTVSFGLEDDNGIIVKVTVTADQAEEFEAALGAALGAAVEDEENNVNTQKEIAQVLFDMRDRFEIIDIDMPTIPEDEEEDQTVEGDGDDLGLEGDAEGDTEGEDDMEGDMDMEADTGEGDAASALTQVIDMMKADAEAKKAEAEARTAEAKAEESRYAATASVAKVKQEEQILDMETHNETKKKEGEEAKRLAQLAKYKHEMGADETEEYPEEEEELTAAKEVSKEELLTMLQQMLKHNS